VKLDPNHTIYRQWLAVAYGEQGDFLKGLEEIDKIQAADPEWASACITEIFLAGSARQFDRADRVINKLLQHMPDWPMTHEQAATLYWTEGRYLQAIAEWRRTAELEKNKERMDLEDRGAEAFRRGGVTAYARVRLSAMEAHKGVSHSDQDFNKAEWLSYAGEYEKSLQVLEEVVRSHKIDALQIAPNPAYIPLHSNPRYQALLQKIYGSSANATASLTR